MTAVWIIIAAAITAFSGYFLFQAFLRMVSRFVFEPCVVEQEEPYRPRG